MFPMYSASRRIKFLVKDIDLQPVIGNLSTSFIYNNITNGDIIGFVDVFDPDDLPDRNTVTCHAQSFGIHTYYNSSDASIRVRTTSLLFCCS